MSSENTDYYAVLDVAPTATQDDIYSAYVKAQETYSLKNPNLLEIFTPEEATAWLDLIEEAYSIVGSPNSRRQYDVESGLFQAQLPSFDLQESADTPSASDENDVIVPEGFGLTKISQYPINSGMEEAIAKQELFDGLFLKKIREYKKIDLTDFSTITCIAIRHLYAIENNNFSVLPAAVFVRGYIIQYCRVLDLDEEKVVPSFMALLKNGL